MATLYDAYQRIEMHIQTRTQDLANGHWLDVERDPGVTGLLVAREQARIEGLKEALLVIAQLQKND